MIDPTPLWDFDDPAGSETRLLAASATATPVDRLVLLTQVARAVGLQQRYDEAHQLLDDVLDDAHADDDEVGTRVLLERGRLTRSAGSPVEAAPLFESAERTAKAAGLQSLRIDALHMRALVADPDVRRALETEALALARSASEPRARNWDASLLNNLGMGLADAGDFTGALGQFEEALTARRRIGEEAEIRVARWMVAWALRNLGRTAEAREQQRALKAELTAAGLTDPSVDEELALLEG